MFRSASAVVVGMILFAGCSGSDGPGTVSVKGTLTVGGKSVNNITITFSPLDTELPTASGTVIDGAFEMFTGAQGTPGAVPGKYKVVLTQNAGSMDSADYMQSGGTGAPSQELSFPERYGSATTSDEEVEVTSGSNDLTIEIPGE